LGDVVALENIGESPRTPLGLEKLEQAARALAGLDHSASGMRAGKPLLPRLLENGRALLNIRRTFDEALRMRRTVPPAAEWLLDNYYIVEQQLHQARQDLSAAYYYELPKLLHGPLAGFPRVYRLTLDLIAQAECRITGETLAYFVRAYQERAPLSMGEIWAIPIMLRIGLIENLRSIMEQAQTELDIQRTANASAEDLLTA
jgi:cyclic beta-1,2-glucan synthetase